MASPAEPTDTCGGGGGGNAVGLLSDARSEIEFDPRALAGLQTVDWRRIDLQVISGGPVIGTALTLHAHSFLIKKLQVHKELSSEAVAMVGRLLMHDAVGTSTPSL